jgi:hypothetical protein
MARTFLPATFLILVASGLSQAQQIDPPSADPPSAATATSAFQLPADQSKLSLTGCGAPGTSPKTEIEFQDQHHNLWYRATNKGLHLTSGRELHVIGGLLPTWNLAAQAGSEGGTAPGNTVTAIAWTLPNHQLGSSPYPPARVRISWIPSLNGPCQTP